jgi:hypothetical protein
MFAAESKPDGELTDMDETDIALAADWTGDAAEFVDTLVAVRFLDRSAGWYQIHNWRKQQPWAAGARQRSEHASKAARARWKKEKGLTFKKAAAETKKQEVTPKNDAASIDEHARSNAPTPAPVPIPSGGNAKTNHEIELERRFEKDPPKVKRAKSRAAEIAAEAISNMMTGQAK